MALHNFKLAQPTNFILSLLHLLDRSTNLFLNLQFWKSSLNVESRSLGWEYFVGQWEIFLLLLPQWLLQTQQDKVDCHGYGEKTCSFRSQWTLCGVLQMCCKLCTLLLLQRPFLASHHSATLLPFHVASYHMRIWRAQAFLSQALSFCFHELAFTLGILANCWVD